MGELSVLEEVGRAGGVIGRAGLIELTSRAEVDRALAHGELVASGRGRYTTAGTDAALALAQSVGGVLSLTSAALHHGWEVKAPPARPHVTVPRGRRITPQRRAGVELHRHDLHSDDVIAGVATKPEATLRQCLTGLPFDEALAVADSALRHGVLPATLRAAALGARGTGAPQARRVAALADGDAANPFESVLRAIALDVPGLRVVAQKGITLPGGRVRPDLVDEDLRIVLEADSFRWHGGREQLASDARRYNELVAAGWLVLRFAWEQVMGDPDYVRAVLLAVVARCGVEAQTGWGPGGRGAA